VGSYGVHVSWVAIAVGSSPAVPSPQVAEQTRDRRRALEQNKDELRQDENGLQEEGKA
jgi:hypothetical protein